MAAGQGFKTFATGDILTASDVNGYLMQGVLVFASTAARDAAITSPQQGQVALTKDTNTIWKYTGATWTNIDTGAVDPLTTKGDLWGYSTTDARVPVGANGTVLTADSTQTLGLKWASVSTAKNFSLLNAGGTALTGASTITVSGISNMDQLMIVVQDASVGATSGITDLGIRFNSDSGSNYLNAFINYTTSFDSFYAASSAITLGSVGAGADLLSGYVFLSGGATSGVKTYQGAGGGDPATNNRWRWYGGVYNSSSTISSVSIINLTGGGTPNFDNGTIYIYGAA